MCLFGLLVREAERCERRGRLRGFPFGFDRRELHLLHFAGRIAGLVTQDQNRQHRGEAETRGDRERAHGERRIAQAQAGNTTIPRARTSTPRHSPRRAVCTNLGPATGLKMRSAKLDELHPHRIHVEFGADRILHPRVGDQDPQRRQVGAQCDEKRHAEVLNLPEPVPAEEEEADERRLEEKRHQALERQRRAEDIADIVREIGPVRAELEFHRDPGGDAHREVDAEELAPELRHVAVDLAPGHHVDRLHDDENPRQAERQRDEQEMVERRDRELQPRQVDDVNGRHAPARDGRGGPRPVVRPPSDPSSCAARRASRKKANQMA